MKKLFVLAVMLLTLVGVSSSFISCGHNPPTVPATPTPVPAVPTATPSLPTQSGVISTTISIQSVRFASNGNLWILQFNSPGTLEQITTAGTLVGSAITSFNGGTFNDPIGLAVDSVTGEVYVCDYENKQLVAFNSAGTWLTTFAKTQLGGSYTEGIAINSAGTTVYGEDDGLYAYLAYSVVQGTPPTYTYQSAANIGTGAGLNYPGCASFDSQGNFWCADYQNHRVVEFGGTGTYQRAVTLQSSGAPQDVAVDHSGNIFVSDTHNLLVQEFNSAGQFLYNIKGTLANPTGLTIDSTGNYLYVGDEVVDQIVEFKIH